LPETVTDVAVGWEVVAMPEDCGTGEELPPPPHAAKVKAVTAKLICRIRFTIFSATV
jgi:hypothetical protein